MPELRRISIRRLPSASHKPLLQSRSGADNKLQSDLQGRNQRWKSAFRFQTPGSLHEFLMTLQNHVAQETLDASYVQALIISISVTAFHTEVSADTAGNCRHGVHFQNYLCSIIVLACTNHFHISRNICMGRAVSGTRCLTYLCRTKDRMVTVFSHQLQSKDDLFFLHS